MSIVLALIVVAFSVTGQLFLKTGMRQVGRVGLEELSDPLRLFGTMITTPLILAAIPLYASSFFMWTVVLSRLQLSVAYPMLAMMYVLIPLASWLVLHEVMSWWQWVGIALIFTGVVLVGREALS